MDEWEKIIQEQWQELDNEIQDQWQESEDAENEKLND